MFKKIQPFLKGLAMRFMLLLCVIRQQKKEPDIRAIRDHKLVNKKFSKDIIINQYFLMIGTQLKSRAG